MDHEQIKQALAAAGYNFTTAAEVIGKSRTTIVRVSLRDIRSRPIARALCALLERSPADVFPDVPEYQEADPAARRASKVAEGRKKIAVALAAR